MLQYLSAFGIDAVFKEKRTLRFQEKKEAYIGLIDAIRLVTTTPSEEHKRMFGAWHIRCELVGSTEVCDALKRIVENPAGSEAQSLVSRT